MRLQQPYKRYHGLDHRDRETLAKCNWYREAEISRKLRVPLCSGTESEDENLMYRWQAIMHDFRSGRW